MNVRTVEFEEREIIKAQVDRVPSAVLAAVNEFRGKNGLPPLPYKIVADRIYRLRREPVHANLFGHILGYGPKVAPELESDAARRLEQHSDLTARLLSDPLPEDSALNKPKSWAPTIDRDPLDFSDLDPEARFIARLQYAMFAGAAE